MARGRRLWLVAIVAAVVLVPVLLVAVQRPAGASSTVLTILAGTAEVARASAGFAAAADGELVAAGDRVRTAERSQAVITFFDGSTLTLEPSTTVTVEDASANGEAISIRISQAIGRTWASVNRLISANSRFELKTPSATAVVRGTGFVTEVRSDGSSSVQTTDGAVEVSAQGTTVSVGAGQATTVAPNAAPTTPLAAPPPPNKLRFGVHSPAYLAVVDPLGRACGVILPGPTLVRQIPGCLVTDVGVEPQLIDVPNAPAGTYSFVVFPRGAGGPYALTASAVAGASLSFNLSQRGAIAAGEKQGSALQVERGADGTLTASGLETISTIERSKLKVVVPSATPRPALGDSVTARRTIDTRLFAPLPSIGFEIGPEVTAAPAPTASPAPTRSPSPSPSPSASPTASPSPIATPAPTPAPRATPSPTETAAPTAAPAPTPTPAPTKRPSCPNGAPACTSPP